MQKKNSGRKPRPQYRDPVTSLWQRRIYEQGHGISRRARWRRHRRLNNGVSEFGSVGKPACSAAEVEVRRQRYAREVRGLWRVARVNRELKVLRPLVGPATSTSVVRRLATQVGGAFEQRRRRLLGA